MNQRITILPGDGIGPSLMDSTLKILTQLECPFEYDYAQAGITSLEAGLDLIPQETIRLIDQNRIALKGPLTTPVGEGFTSINVTLRKKFNLYVNMRPAITFPGTSSKYENIDIITIRENTEGMYSGEGQILTEDGERAEAVSVITKKGSAQILNFAYELAQRKGLNKIAVVHKANILKSTSGLFVRTAREIAQKYPHIKTKELIVDNCCMQLVMNPHQFEIIVTTNLFGDIISDLCAGLVGGLGMAPAANIGKTHAIFEAVHGSAPDIAGKNIANPTSLILASAMMLDHLKMDREANRIRRAIRDVIQSKDRLTPDLGGNYGTTHFTDAIIERL